LFFQLSIVAALLLGAVSHIVFNNWLLTFSLAGYFLLEKVYRGFEAHSRILFNYKANGLSDLLHVVSGFILLIVCLPRYGLYSIFPCFILSYALAIVYLALTCRLEFQWVFQFSKAVNYIRGALPVSLMFYAITFFNVVPMTVVAFFWDKTTLGYYAFAYRIFEICLSIFPFLIRDVIRTRMYFQLAENKDQPQSPSFLVLPMLVYGVTVTIFWLAVYWWGTYAITRYVSDYRPSMLSINILLFSLLPLGVNKICSDYLCSRVYNRFGYVNIVWVAGIFLQIAGILIVHQRYHDALFLVPIVYLVVTFMVYILLAGTALKTAGAQGAGVTPAVRLLLPLFTAFMAVTLVRSEFYPAPDFFFYKNIVASAVSIIGTAVVSFLLIRHEKIRLALQL
jgi:hypothetical protein